MSRNVFIGEGFAIALLPLVRAPKGPSVLGALLKVLPGPELKIHESMLEVSAPEGVILRQRGAFGLGGACIAGPHIRRFSEDASTDSRATTMRWSLNESIVEVPCGDGPSDLRATWLAVQIPLPNDVHLVVDFFNRSAHTVNIATAMREAVCWADGVPYPSVAGGVWNGPYLVAPGRKTRRSFSLDDFPGVPRSGTHEMSVGFGGERSSPETVTWR